MGCSCKKRNQTVKNNSTTININEGSTNMSPQQVIIVDEHVDKIIKKIEEISTLNNDKNQ